ncbi:cryptochrome/photolyase family protein [Arcicella rosea]|uniref:Deoxyribodipyrimidine photolyase-related protein n=1 Tax=Arcicella rosea TaxID=502909 RepID=A0A841EKA5_9BACT|nr:cryptochrome/photolyase family protein [Arcicella rosea]MBB6002634.1 deoxyribodipyrimidine photolyase-related protein [Arcicella rosea]
MQTIKLIFPHQLFQLSPLFAVEGTFYLVEEFLFFRQYNFHKQKIAFHRATMKYYENFLLEKGFSVNYVQATEKESDIRVLIPYLHSLGVASVVLIDPVDDWLLKRVKASCHELNIKINVLESPMFLNTGQELEHFFKPSKKKFFQTEFYKQERISRKILLEESGEPIGGQWTFDVDNRKKYPKGKAIVKCEYPLIDTYAQEARAYTNTYFADNIGIFSDSINYPIGYKASEQWLHQFLENRMVDFGDYEDAIVHKELLLNHSLLTPMLNVGMLSPAQVLKHTLHYSHANDVPINSLEGFIRQIIGWREFIRGVYVSKGSEERTKNYWGFTKKIPKSFYDGNTGIFPVDETIKKVLKTGYCHHIERLMVLGNFMLLCEFDPDEVYRWFMEFFIDAYDWVMVPNVYGMSQFADGGMMSTKPYISASNYLMKMSDYPKGDWQETWDALFWRFLDKQRVFFLKNPRLSMLVKTFDKWDEDKKQSIHHRANEFLARLEENR